MFRFRKKIVTRKFCSDLLLTLMIAKLFGKTLRNLYIPVYEMTLIRRPMHSYDHFVRLTMGAGGGGLH